jgi:Dolichyl-phosphate-mannose-protein mannosyltransferase
MHNRDTPPAPLSRNKRTQVAAPRRPGRAWRSLFTSQALGSRGKLLLWLFILLKLGLHLWLINPHYDLHRDEYLHLDQAKHLAWGYVSVPPATSWISYLILLLGNHVFWIKFFPALFGALTMVVVWKTVEALRGNLFALILSAVAVTFSVMLRINILYQPNSLDILCWTLVYFSFIKYIATEKPNWLWMAAVTFALGFLNKYNIAFLLLGFLPALLLTAHRQVLLQKHFYFAMALALLLISPNLIWQLRNGFPVFHHLNELATTQLKNVNRVDFLKEQLIYFAGSVFIILAALLAFFAYKPFRKYRVFGWTFLFTISLFMYFQAKAYYAIGLYPVLIAFGSVYLGQVLRQRWQVFLCPVLLLLPIIVFLASYKVAFPVLSPSQIRQQAQRFKNLNLLRWEDGRDHALPQDFADMLGWRELAAKVDSAYSLLRDQQHTLVLCDNYGQAGAINYYSGHKGMQAVSMSADYINWFPLDTREVKNVILVKDTGDSDKNRERERRLFHNVSLFGEVKNKHAREQGTRIFILEGATTSINMILRAEIAERKKILLNR